MIGVLTLKGVHLEFGGPICLRCMNRRYEVHLAHRDCREEGPRECSCCRKTGNVVTGLKLSGHWKLLAKPARRD